MTRTLNATPAMKIECLIRLAADSGHAFICEWCGKPILPGHKVQFDHTLAVGRGGANRSIDLRPLHAEAKGHADGRDCHYRKTHRPRSLATALGGDNYEAKKATKIAAAHAINKPPPGADRPTTASRAWPKRKFPTQQRGFAPRGSRPMNRKRRA